MLSTQAIHMTQGTYAAVKYTEDSINRLYEFANKYNIPNLIDPSEIHTTMIFSKEPLPDLEHKITDISGAYLTATPDHFESWLTRPVEGVEQTRCLILTLDSDELVAYQHLLSHCFHAKYDFEKYTPHIAISYDIANFHYSEISSRVKEIGNLDVELFYAEELDLNWSPSAGKKQSSSLKNS